MRIFLDRTLKRIEREANDDLLLIRDLGPKYYSTPDLYELLDQFAGQRYAVSRKKNQTRKVVFGIPLFFAGGALSFYVDALVLSAVCFVVVLLVGGIFVYQSLRIRQDHPTYGHSMMIEQQIRQELRRRQEESSIL